MRSVRVLSTIAAVGTFFVIVLGKIVRETGASKSIPDWPLAFGRLVPEMTPLVFWEWSHRLLVLIVFITMVALIICAARLPGRLWLYCSLSLLMLLVPAADRRAIDPVPAAALGVRRDRLCLRDALLRERGRSGGVVAAGRRGSYPRVAAVRQPWAILSQALRAIS